MSEVVTATAPKGMATGKEKQANGKRDMEDVAKTSRKPRKKGVRKEGGYAILGFRDNPQEKFLVKAFKTAKRAIAWADDNADLLDRLCVGHTLWKYYEVDDDGKMIPAA